MNKSKSIENFYTRIDQLGLANRYFTLVRKNSPNGKRFHTFLRVKKSIAEGLYKMYEGKEGRVRFSLLNLFNGIVGVGCQEGDEVYFDCDLFEFDTKGSRLFDSCMRFDATKGLYFTDDAIEYFYAATQEEYYTHIIKMCKSESLGEYIDYHVTEAMMLFFLKRMEELKPFIMEKLDSKDKLLSSYPEIVPNARFYRKIVYNKVNFLRPGRKKRPIGLKYIKKAVEEIEKSLAKPSLI